MAVLPLPSPVAVGRAGHLDPHRVRPTGMRAAYRVGGAGVRTLSAIASDRHVALVGAIPGGHGRPGVRACPPFIRIGHAFWRLFYAMFTIGYPSERTASASTGACFRVGQPGPCVNEILKRCGGTCYRLWQDAVFREPGACRRCAWRMKLEELEHIFALLVLGAFVGHPFAADSDHHAK